MCSQPWKLSKNKRITSSITLTMNLLTILFILTQGPKIRSKEKHQLFYRILRRIKRFIHSRWTPKFLWNKAKSKFHKCKNKLIHAKNESPNFKKRKICLQKNWRHLNKVKMSTQWLTHSTISIWLPKVIAFMNFSSSIFRSKTSYKGTRMLLFTEHLI